MLTRGGIITRNPRLMFNTDPVVEPGTTPPVPVEPKFPANTAVKEMTSEQQVEYWKHQSRKHEDRANAYGDVTPQRLAELQQEAETLRRKTQTAEEAAIEEAKEAGRTEVRSVLATERVTVALERATQGRIIDPAAAFALDKSSFIDGEKANIDAIKAWVDANSTEAVDPTPRPFPNLYQGPREPITTTDRATGKAEAEKRFGKKS